MSSRREQHVIERGGLENLVIFFASQMATAFHLIQVVYDFHAFEARRDVAYGQQARCGYMACLFTSSTSSLLILVPPCAQLVVAAATAATFVFPILFGKAPFNISYIYLFVHKSISAQPTVFPEPQRAPGYR